MLVHRADSEVLQTGSLWCCGEKVFSFPWCSSDKSVDTREDQRGLCRSPRMAGWVTVVIEGEVKAESSLE